LVALASITTRRRFFSFFSVWGGCHSGAVPRGPGIGAGFAGLGLLRLRPAVLVGDPEHPLVDRILNGSGVMLYLYAGLVEAPDHLLGV
jgi:hypothetical protein